MTPSRRRRNKKKANKQALIIPLNVADPLKKKRTDESLEVRHRMQRMHTHTHTLQRTIDTYTLLRASHTRGGCLIDVLQDGEEDEVVEVEPKIDISAEEAFPVR